MLRTRGRKKAQFHQSPRKLLKKSKSGPSGRRRKEGKRKPKALREGLIMDTGNASGARGVPIKQVRVGDKGGVLREGRGRLGRNNVTFGGGEGWPYHGEERESFRKAKGGGAPGR